MPTNHTQNYQLSQWVKSDQVKMEDFNADNAKIDGALKAQADALAAEASARTAQAASLEAAVAEHSNLLPKLGNCQIYTTSYTGDGTCGEEHPTQFTFPCPPVLVVVYTSNGFSIILMRDCTTFSISTYQSCTVTWGSNTVSLCSANSVSQLNDERKLYYVTALCSKS